MAYRDIKVLGKSEALLNYKGGIHYGNERICTGREHHNKHTGREYPACMSLQLKSVLSSRVHFTVAISAVYRFVTARLEGYLCLYAA